MYSDQVGMVWQHVDSSISYQHYFYYIQRVSLSSIARADSLTSCYDARSYLCSCTCLLLVARKLCQLRLINSLQLRARKSTQGAGKSTSKRAGDSEHNIRLGLSRKLEGEAGSVVALGESSGVEHTTRQVLDVNAREGVGGAGVAADVEELGVVGCGVEEIGSEVCGLVRVFEGSSIPIVWNFLLAPRVKINKLSQPSTAF